MTNIMNEIRDTTRDPADIKRIIKEYYEQLQTHKFNTDETDKFLVKTYYQMHDLSLLFLQVSQIHVNLKFLVIKSLIKYKQTRKKQKIFITQSWIPWGE